MKQMSVKIIKYQICVTKHVHGFLIFHCCTLILKALLLLRSLRTCAVAVLVATVGQHIWYGIECGNRNVQTHATHCSRRAVYQYSICWLRNLFSLSTIILSLLINRCLTYLTLTQSVKFEAISLTYFPFDIFLRRAVRRNLKNISNALQKSILCSYTLKLMLKLLILNISLYKITNNININFGCTEA